MCPRVRVLQIARLRNGNGFVHVHGGGGRTVLHVRIPVQLARFKIEDVVQGTALFARALLPDATLRSPHGGEILKWIRY